MDCASSAPDGESKVTNNEVLFYGDRNAVCRSSGCEVSKMYIFPGGTLEPLYDYEGMKSLLSIEGCLEEKVCLQRRWSPREVEHGELSERCNARDCVNRRRGKELR